MNGGSKTCIGGLLDCQLFLFTKMLSPGKRKVLNESIVLKLIFQLKLNVYFITENKLIGGPRKEFGLMFGL